MNAPDERKGGIPGTRIVVGVGLVVAIGAWIWNAQKSNQIIPPVPVGPAAPVVPELPGLIAKLGASKSRCEGRASGAIALVRARGGGEAELAKGRRLYVDAKAQSDGCINFLVAALSRRFVESDSAEVSKCLEEEQARETAFVDWADGLERANLRTFSSSPLEDLKGLVDELIKRSDTQNAEAVKQLTAALERCRMKEWGDLEPAQR